MKGGYARSYKFYSSSRSRRPVRPRERTPSRVKTFLRWYATVRTPAISLDAQVHRAVHPRSRPRAACHRWYVSQVFDPFGEALSDSRPVPHRTAT